MDFKIYQTFPKELMDEWNALLAKSISHVPFLRYEYLNTWWDTRGGGEWRENSQLEIITAWQDGRLVGIAPFFLAEWEGKQSLLLLGSIEISDYLDLIVRLDDLDHFVIELMRFLADSKNGLPGWERLDLYNIFENSQALTALHKSADYQGWQYTSEPFRPSLSIDLPNDWEKYLSNIDKKQRHEIRRKMRRAYTNEQPVRWYIVDDPAMIDTEIEAFLRLMELDPDKARFLTPLMRQNFRQTIKCAFDFDCLLLAFLEVDGNKAAAYLSFDYLDQLWVYNSGINPAFIEYSPGWVLLGELIKWSIENGKKAFDFMRGDENYKYRFGAKKRDVMRVILSRS
jgi:CelD/BcsL family acetyltransferase involved in cellulose biosynthesis